MPVAEYLTAKEARRDQARIRRANRRQLTNEIIRERQGSEAARQLTQAQRSELKQADIRKAAESRVQTQQDVASNRRVQRVENAAIFGAANSSIGASIGMVVALFFIMIMIYVVVKNGSNFGKLTGSIGDFIAGLSSNNALFIKQPKTGGS
jgi:uncharacterized membrane protein